MCFDNCAKYDNLIDKIQALERLSTNKAQILEKTNNENKKIFTHRGIRVEPTMPLHYEVEEQHCKFIRTSTLICPVTI